MAVTANTFFNGPVTNMGAMFFQGAISNALVNSGSFNLNNNATLTVAPVNTGTINVDGNDTLTVNPAWANAGSVQINGGVLAGGNLTNTANNNVSGFGTISNLIGQRGPASRPRGGTLTLGQRADNAGRQRYQRCRHRRAQCPAGLVQQRHDHISRPAERSRAER